MIVVHQCANVADAMEGLDELAHDCENANYHTEAGLIWNTIIPALGGITEPTWVYVIVEGVVHAVQVAA